jgi:hypothetical protein
MGTINARLKPEGGRTKKPWSCAPDGLEAVRNRIKTSRAPANMRPTNTSTGGGLHEGSREWTQAARVECVGLKKKQHCDGGKKNSSG